MFTFMRKVFPVVFVIMFVLAVTWIVAMFWTLMSMEPHELAQLHCATAYNPQECAKMVVQTLEGSATSGAAVP